jgi:4'-phosphopantetheinyl transferase
MPRCLPVRATEGSVHVWRADLAAVEDEMGELLCTEEHERALQIRDVHRRRLWMRSRGVLRALLARYVDGDPRTLRFTLGLHGKPALRDRMSLGDDAGDLHFNMSHSGTIALYAVTAGCEVGIDVEVPRRQIDELAIAERVLGQEQARRLADLDPQARTREFLRAWVVREALAKCHGTGLGTAPHGDLPAANLWTSELDAGPDAIAAVAVDGGRCELRYWAWCS